VYAKLRSETVTVTPGQKIKAKDHLGQVYTDKDDVSELQFQIWKNSEKQDPEAWLANR
jgi:septal ring factor EnvC (AmiA/AmiB activator)